MTTGTEIATTADLDAQIAAAERDALVLWRGEAIAFRDVPERIARTSGREERDRLLGSWVEVLEALNPRYAERLAGWMAAGTPRADGFDPVAFAVDLEQLLILSETPYYAALRRALALVDIEQGDATIGDLWHVLRGGAWSQWFGARDVRRAVEAVGREPADPGGLDGWPAAEAMLASTTPRPGVVAAVDRAYGSLAGSPAWLAEELGVAGDDVAAVADFAAFARLARIRRAIGELNYELRLYEDPDPSLARAYYSGIVGHTIGASVPEAAYLYAIPRPWASAHLLREEIVAATLTEHLEHRHGPTWWRDPAAAQLAAGVGAAAREEDALAQLGYDALDWRPLLRQVRTRLIGEMSGYGGPNITTRAGTRKV